MKFKKQELLHLTQKMKSVQVLDSAKQKELKGGIIIEEDIFE